MGAGDKEVTPCPGRESREGRMGGGSHGRQGLRLPSNVPSRERASAGTGVRRRVRAARGSGAVGRSVFHAHPHPRSSPSLSLSPPRPPSPPATRPRDCPQFEQQRQGVPRPHLPIPVLAGTLRTGAHQDAHPARRPCPRPLVSHFSSTTTRMPLMHSGPVATQNPVPAPLPWSSRTPTDGVYPSPLRATLAGQTVPPNADTPPPQTKGSHSQYIWHHPSPHACLSVPSPYTNFDRRSCKALGCMDGRRPTHPPRTQGASLLPTFSAKTPEGSSGDGKVIGIGSGRVPSQRVLSGQKGFTTRSAQARRSRTS